MKRLMYGAVFGLMFAAGSAQAADFTFNVPIDVQNMNVDFTEGRVDCVISDSRNSTIGVGQQFFGLDSFGNFQDTVTVSVNANAGIEPGTANAYQCILSLLGESGQFESIGQGFTAQFLSATPTGQVSGTLTQQAGSR